MTRSRRGQSYRRKIRFLDDALILEDGERWDRVRPASSYFSTACEVRELSPLRAVLIDGRAAPTDMTLERYRACVTQALATNHPEGEDPAVQFLVYSRGDHTIVGVVPTQDWF
ncbi:hypothetical protein FE697_005175 [Mumia zhuanghuii]|uniref:Uncharacterized protein n=1 Tax=Mumia zhuanghuii TaxID=2585211 RepID=A0A5Q6S4S5_9ACTN|nr:MULTISPECIES: hypothetical protein [Mumia]KAA1425260.1 hypothetical protein FE697_005175 [Mumia zhuanghuii]